MTKLICHNCKCEFDSPYNAYYCQKPECQAARAEYKRLDKNRRAAEGRKKPKEGKPKEPGMSTRLCNYCGKPLPKNRYFNHVGCAKALEKQGRCDDNYGYIEDAEWLIDGAENAYTSLG